MRDWTFGIVAAILIAVGLASAVTSPEPAFVPDPLARVGDYR